MRLSAVSAGGCKDKIAVGDEDCIGTRLGLRSQCPAGARDHSIPAACKFGGLHVHDFTRGFNRTEGHVLRGFPGTAVLARQHPADRDVEAPDRRTDPPCRFRPQFGKLAHPSGIAARPVALGRDMVVGGPVGCRMAKVDVVSSRTERFDERFSRKKVLSESGTCEGCKEQGSPQQHHAPEELAPRR